MAIERIRRTIKGDGFERIHDYLREDDFSPKKMFRYGFPEVPTCLAYNAVQSLMAIGNYKGMVKILGKPGMEVNFWHPEEVSIKQLVFVNNKKQLLSLCDNNTIYLWDCSGKTPEVAHKLSFQQKQHSKPTCLHLSSDQSWAYIGCEGGDVYVLGLASMSLCGYTIYWNKSCGSNRCGRVVDILENPWDPDKLLIGFAEGLAVVWSLQKSDCHRYRLDLTLTSICWGENGKTFYAGYEGGNLATWNLKTTSKPDYLGKPTIDGLKQPKCPSNVPCQDIGKTILVRQKEGDPLMVVAGGVAEAAQRGFCSAVSVFTGRTGARLIPLDMPIVDLLTMNCPTTGEDSLVVLCDRGLKAFSLSSKQNLPQSIPYPLHIHSSAVSCVTVVSSVSDEIISTLMSMKSKCEVEELSSLKPMMMSGGKWVNHSSQKYSSDVILTGHMDGSVRVWNLVGALFQELSTVESSSYLKRNVVPLPASSEVDGEVREGPTVAATSTSTEKESLAADQTVKTSTSRGSLSPPNTLKTSQQPPSSHLSSTERGRSRSPHSPGTTPITSPAVASPQSPAIFGFSSPSPHHLGDENGLGIVHLWFGQDDACLLASNTSLGVMSFALKSTPQQEDVKVVDVLFSPDAEDSPQTSPPGSPGNSPTQLPQPPYVVIKDGRQLSPGFHMQLYCNTFLDSRKEDPNSLAVNCIHYTSKLAILVYGMNKGLAVVDAVKGSVLSTITSNEELHLMADPKRRRESVPAAFSRKWQTVRHPAEPKSPKPSHSSPNTMMRRRTTPDIGMATKPLNPPLTNPPLPEPVAVVDVCCVTSLKIAEMAVDKHAHALAPVLWIGTSLGLVAGIHLLEGGLQAKSGSPGPRQVDLVPSGLTYDMKSNVLNMFPISETGYHLPNPCLRYVHGERTVAPAPAKGGVITRVDSRENTRLVSYVVCVSETRLKAYEVQKTRSIAKMQLVDGTNDFLRSADFCWLKETPCLLCTSINAKVFIVSVKGLHLVTELTMKDSFEFCQLSSMGVSELGRIFFLANDQELQLMSLYKSDIERSSQALPELFLEEVKAAPTEEVQSPGLFSSLFGQKPTPTDRKQLFGASGRPPPVAKSEAAKSQGKKSEEVDGMKGKLNKLVEGFDERGERLSEIEEKTARMKDSASDFEVMAAKLARKYH